MHSCVVPWWAEGAGGRARRLLILSPSFGQGGVRKDVVGLGQQFIFVDCNYKYLRSNRSNRQQVWTVFGLWSGGLRMRPGF